MMEPRPTTEPAGSHPWTFLSNHAHALLCLATDEDCRVRDLALRIGITERATQRILADLEAAGYLVRERHGRRNHHRLVLDRPMRHPVERAHTVRDLVDALVAIPSAEPAGSRPTAPVSAARGPRRGTRASERPAPAPGA